MIAIIFGFTGLMMAGVAIVYYAAAHAPTGHEDDQGFHYASGSEAVNDIPAAIPVYTR